jgi:WD40 repeat protein
LPFYLANTSTNIPFSAHGKYMALPTCDKRDAYFACTQGSVGVWEIATGKEHARLPYLGEIYALSFSPDGKYLLFGGCDKFINRTCAKGSAHVQAIDTGQAVSQMTHDGVITLATFSPDGKYVISKSTENTARVWEAATGKEVTRITYPGVINLLSFSSDGNSIFSAGCDQQTGNEACPQGSIRVWKYHPEDLIAEACSRLTRNLTRDEWQQYVGNVLPYQAVCENLPIESGETITSP